MSGKEFLILDIDKLFEEHSIKDIEEIEKRIEYESDRKKMELRTLVGERYRDLIQAADTIAQMRQTSKDVILRIADIERTFHHLQRKYLIGFKIDKTEEAPVVDEQSENISDSVVMQIKILMDIPERVWSAMDERNLLLASQLLTVAQRINYSLAFEVGRTILAKRYPIVGKQWSIIQNLKKIIFNVCQETLRSLDLSVEAAGNCLAALVLVYGWPATDLLEKLIGLRCCALESIIKDENAHGVRQRIKMSVRLLTESVVVIYCCFVKRNERGGRGLVSEYVMNLKNVETREMLKNLDLDEDLLEKFVPAVTLDHRPFETNNFVELSIEEEKKIFNDWLGWIEKFVNTEIRKLTNLVTSVKGIYNIREESVCLELPENWDKLRRELELEKSDFWSSFYQPILTARVKTIIEDKWREAMESLETRMKQLLTKISNDKFEYPEKDLRWYVWKDSPSDIPDKLTKIPDARRWSLVAKSRGYSTNLLKLAETFDHHLSELLSDLELYLYETDMEERRSAIKDNFLSMGIAATVYTDKYTDRTEIQSTLRTIGEQSIRHLVKFIRDELIVENTKIGDCQINAIFLARFLQALTILCPGLSRCFTLSRISTLNVATNVKWQTICDLLRDESAFVWSVWANRYKIKIRQISKDIFPQFSPFPPLSSVISEWERVVIEEEAEEGKSIKSVIFVPYQASVDLHKFLARVIADFNKIIPHTIPKKVMHDIVEEMARVLFDHYDELAKNVRQKRAFQILFDVKYVTLLMVPRENKSLMDRSIQVCNNILANIDPFDSDVFYPFIHANVKKNVQRSLLIFGNLVPHIEQLHSVLGARSEYAASDGSKSMAEPPGGLAVCTGAPWFPPLAVTAPTRNLPLMPVTISDKPQRKRTPLLKEQQRNDFGGATIKSGAAAFFGAMGSDWFGTG